MRIQILWGMMLYRWVNFSGSFKDFVALIFKGLGFIKLEDKETALLRNFGKL